MTNDSSGVAFDAWLSSAGLPNRVMHQLLDFYEDSARCFEAVDRKEELIRQIIPDRFLRLLEISCNENTLKAYGRLIEKHHIRSMGISDRIYPESLVNIEDPPAILFFQGNPGCLSNRILAMVGSRAASYNGQKAARKIASDLSSSGVTIISGLAFGIDAAAHNGCLEGRSPTIAVTGCGLDIVYPAANTELRDRILRQDGLILSEYAPGEKPSGWHFPVRNRIITGFCSALIVMEAKIKSGSMISVRHALDQGKDVFVYPGDPSSELYSGNHQLLREGGTYFTCAEDILSDLQWLDNPHAVGQNSDCSAERKDLTPDQTAVVEALKPGTLSFEQLLLQTGLQPSALMSALTILQINGMTESLPGKYFQLKESNPIPEES